ncbi:MAG: HNH endonuclease [Nanoarchaeota archaeon]|nr:HNH endonuclease [Nanoarchaeota archaeon]
MSFSKKVKEDVLVKSGRHCCICHKFCGLKIEIHHIKPKSEGGLDTFENAIALCFDCHADMTSYDYQHPKGTKYQESELIQHRDNWYEKVKGNIGTANKKEVIETDIKVFDKLTKILPWNGTIEFLRTNNFAGFSFELSKLNDIDEFLYYCQNPAFEFIDPDLEGLRVELFSNCKLFRNFISTKTFPTNNVDRNSIPEEWEISEPERFNEAVNLIHEASDSICQAYDTLVQTATRKLGTLPEEIL